MVVGLYGAVSGEETLLLTALVSERIVVRVTADTIRTDQSIVSDRKPEIDPSVRLRTRASLRRTGTRCGSEGRCRTPWSVRGA